MERSGEQFFSVNPGTDVYRPAMPPLARANATGLEVLAALHRNGFAAFPRSCLDHPVIRLRIPGRALVLISAPEGVQHVLASHAEHYRRLPAARRILGPIVGRGLLVSEGKLWRRQRKVMAPAFTPRTVPVLAEHILRCTEAMCGRLEAAEDGPIDLLTELQRLSLEIAAVSMFSLEADGFNADLRAMVSRYMATIGHPAPSDFLLPGGIPTLLAIRRALFRMRWKGLIRSVVARRQAHGLNAAPRDLFDLMAAAYGEGDPGLLADEVATMIVAGHETTALALFWACLLLAHAPVWQERVAQEAQQIDVARSPAAVSLARLVQTRAVVQEALRLYPPAFMTARHAIRRDEICGVEVPAGAFVLIPIWLLHRNPRWFPSPDAFNPERFMGGKEPDRFAYLPFGAGPHSCIGAQLAMAEAVLVLARLLQRSDIAVTDARPVLPVGAVTTRPDHAPMFYLRHRRA